MKSNPSQMMQWFLCCLHGLPLSTAFTLSFTAVLLVQPKVMAIDTAVVNANVITVDEARPKAEAFAIEGDQFVQVGSNEEIKALIKPNTQIIDLRQLTARHRPIIIAHRGGVVSPLSAECSLTAIRLASEQGYDMVELDVQKSSDGVPVVFHDRGLLKACGKNGHIADFSATELEATSYLVGNDRIVRLATALKSCRRLGLGVMLDIKAGRDSREFLEAIDKLLVKHDLPDATISLSGGSAARRFLRHVRFTPTAEEMRRLRTGETLDLSHRFWFGLPKQLQPSDVSKLKSAGALIIPAINTFRYPASGHFELAKDDIERLTKEGVDGFQIDSVYYPLFSKEE